MAVVDETLTIDPPPLARIAGMVCLQPRISPVAAGAKSREIECPMFGS